LLSTLLILLSLEYDTNKYQVNSDYRITNHIITQKCHQIFGPFPPTMYETNVKAFSTEYNKPILQSLAFRLQ